ncbi:hypothetical protein OXX69_008922, partial [Metschnikowia pulcherrima]
MEGIQREEASSQQQPHTGGPISNLSAGLKSVSLTDQQQNAVNLNLLQQHLHNEAAENSVMQSRISRFFANQPTEGYTLFSHRSAPNG